jgi:hypothetical protein
LALPALLQPASGLLAPEHRPRIDGFPGVVFVEVCLVVEPDSLCD